MKHYPEMSSRDRIEAFIKYNFEDDELEHISTVTKEMEPKLRFSLVDRYGVKVKSPKSLRKFIHFADSFPDVEIYAMFYLNVGYTDAFVAGTLQDDTNQVDKDFVTPALSAAAEIQDKAGVV